MITNVNPQKIIFENIFKFPRKLSLMDHELRATITIYKQDPGGGGRILETR